MIKNCRECDLEPTLILEYDVKNYKASCDKCGKKVEANSSKMCVFRWNQKNKEISSRINFCKAELLSHMRQNQHVDGMTIAYSARWVSNHYGISKYAAKCALRELKDKGLIVYNHFPSPCDYEYEAQTCYCENHLPYWGYTIAGYSIEN